MLNLGVFHLFYNQVRRRRVHIFVGASILCIYVFTQKPSWETIVSEHEMKLIPTSLSSKFSLIPRETTGKSMEEAFYNKENIPVNASHKNMAAAEIQATNLHRRQIVEAFEKSAITSVKNGTLHSQNSSQESSKNEGDSLKGFLNHHIWEYVCNHQVASLRGFILYPKLPSKRRFLFSSSSKQGRNVNNFGERVFGFLVPPSSGEYQFSISSSGDSELWLSSDEKLENLQKIAYLAWQGRPGRSKQGNFSNFQSQISSSIFLHAKVSYCIDIIHKHQSGKTRLDVVWRPPNSTQYTTIKSEYLRAKINDSHVKDYAVPLEDYEEQSQESHDIKLPYIDFKEVAQVLPTCLYQPSYLVKHKLIRFEGARNKSNTHFASVYPPDETNNSLPLLENENIWWWENALGNSMINEETALSVVSLFMGALEARFRHSYKLRKIISVQQVADPKKGDRFFVELMLTSNRTGGALVLAEYVYKFPEENRLCFPEGFYWSKQVTVNVIVPVKNSGRWAFYFIRNIAEILRQTRDLNIHVILIDYESSDINIEEALRRSTIQSYTIVKFPAETSFQRALALHRGAQAVTDPHSILFLCDLHLKIPPDLISTIRKHCVEGKMAFAPVVKRLRCGYHPGVPLGYWETLGFGLLAIFKSDFDRAGGMNVQEFRGWGGEDWELLDRVLMSGLEVERLKIPDFYHFYHPNFGKSNQRNGA